MKRNLKKYITEYDKKYLNSKRNKGAFFVSDYYQIFSLSKDAAGGLDLWELIDNALKAGYMIGYRTAQRDERKIKSVYNQKGNS